MNEQEHSSEHEEEGHPREETLPPESPTAGEAALEKEGVEFEGAKAGKGGDETHGAGDDDDPNG